MAATESVRGHAILFNRASAAAAAAVDRERLRLPAGESSDFRQEEAVTAAWPKHSMESEATAIDPSTSTFSPRLSSYRRRYVLVSIAGNRVRSEQVRQSGRKTRVHRYVQPGKPCRYQNLPANLVPAVL